MSSTILLMGHHKLRFLHEHHLINRIKLEQLRGVSTEILKTSLLPGCEGSLKVRPDGMILDGHHRVVVLKERGEDVDVLPREIIEKKS
jgi:hypothetical protein